MADNSPNQWFTRRRFIAASAAPLSALWLQGCASLGASSTSDSPAGPLPQSDHPLTRLSFPSSGRIESSMSIQPLAAPAHTSEGYTTWHKRGDHPYPFRTNLPLASSSPEAPLALDDAISPDSPPTGIRSAVPLGGFGTGSIELRGNGSLADWQIFNNSPGGGGNKVHLEDAFFGIRVSPIGGIPRAWAIRTHPPEKLPGVQRLDYAGAFPVSRLQVVDPAFPLDATLFAYNDFRLHDATQAARPAVIFSFVLSNPTNEALETAVMFNLPNHVDGTYRTERGFSLSKSGAAPESGELHVSFASALGFSSGVAPEISEIWDTFEKKGDFVDLPELGIFAHGAVSTHFVIEAGASRTVTMILSWRFPHRTFAEEQTGNAYAQRYQSAREVGASISNSLPDIWESLITWDTLCSAGSLPNAVQNSLRNSLAQLHKSAFCTADGRWRFWDSFSTPILSSLDGLLFRALPLLYFYPDAMLSQLRAYATRQKPDGQFSTALGLGNRYPLDDGPTSQNGRSISTFILLTYLFYRNSGDEAVLRELWPYIAKALPWHLALISPEGLPTNLPAFSDWTSYSEEGVDLSDALLHLGAISAIREMAQTLKLTEYTAEISRLITSGQKAIENTFWTGTHYRARQTKFKPANDAADSESLLGFVWLYVSGFDSLVDAEALQQHLDYIEKQNQPAIDPTSRGSESSVMKPADSMIWSALHAFCTSSSSGIKTADETATFFEKTLNDAWGHYEEIDTTRGLPWSNPHHVSHLAIWFVFFAQSGQLYNASDRTLRFNPASSSRSRLPFFTPRAHGFLSAQRAGRYRIEVLSGKLELTMLQVGEEIKYRDVYLEAGQALDLR